MKSLVEVKYKGMTITLCGHTWFQFLQKNVLPLLIYRYSQPTLHITHNFVFHEHTKHIDKLCAISGEIGDVSYVQLVVMPSIKLMYRFHYRS